MGINMGPCSATNCRHNLEVICFATLLLKRRYFDLLLGGISRMVAPIMFMNWCSDVANTRGINAV